MILGYILDNIRMLLDIKSLFIIFSSMIVKTLLFWTKVVGKCYKNFNRGFIRKNLNFRNFEKSDYSEKSVKFKILFYIRLLASKIRVFVNFEVIW